MTQGWTHTPVIEMAEVSQQEILLLAEFVVVIKGHEWFFVVVVLGLIENWHATVRYLGIFFIFHFSCKPTDIAEEISLAVNFRTLEKKPLMFLR